MIDQLMKDIQGHLCLLELALKSSELICTYAQKEDLDGIVDETDNRQRIVNIITQAQRKIEDQINLLDASDVNQETLLILKSWFNDLNIWSEAMLTLDRQTVELLAQQKENTGKEIALVFKNKEVFKGYNHELKK